MSADNKPKTLDELRKRKAELEAEMAGGTALSERRKLEAEIAALEKKLSPPFKQQVKSAVKKEGIFMLKGIAREVKDVLGVGPMKCEKHPAYTGKMMPRVDCERCLEIYRSKHQSTGQSII